MRCLRFGEFVLAFKRLVACQNAEVHILYENKARFVQLEIFMTHFFFYST